ncbi:hypothetical protein PINS_up014621 [Pythium insidiosum]|nr:hypothetical protein PINS_up014621 [Pythium insidiosum]
MRLEALRSPDYTAFDVNTPGYEAALAPAALRARLMPRSNTTMDSATTEAPKRKATAKTEKVVDEKVLRRRMQYKLHQRRHRAKQKQKTLDLEADVSRLSREIAQLNANYEMLRSRHVFTSRGLCSGAPVKTALEFFRLYEFGHVDEIQDVQERYMRAAMIGDLDGPDYCGLDFVLEQWRLYAAFFDTVRNVAESIEVSTSGDMTIVMVHGMIQLRARRDGALALYPSLLGREDLVQVVVGKLVEIPGKYRFIFSETGAVTWFGTDFDFIAGLQRALGSLDMAATCLEGARISCCTGQITAQSEKSRMLNDSPSRRSVDFLLS